MSKTKVKQEIQEYFGKLSKVKKHTPGVFQDLKNPRNLGLFFYVETVEELDQVRSLLNQIKSSYKKIDAIVFYPGFETLDVITNKSIYLFDLNDFSLLGKMKGELIEYLSENQFELLISFVSEPVSLSKKIVSEINADFKIGPKHKEMNELYDMTIAFTQDKLKFMDFFDQTEHYVAALNLKM